MIKCVLSFIGGAAVTVLAAVIISPKYDIMWELWED